MSDRESAVDWEWVNQLPSVAIFDAVALSLGYALHSIPPVGRKFENLPLIRDINHRERTILAYEAARAGKLKLVARTAQRGAKFNADSEFGDGQWWEVDIVDFRRFCDLMGWLVPKAFLPRGYVVSNETSSTSLFTSPQILGHANNDRGGGLKAGEPAIGNPQADRSPKPMQRQEAQELELLELIVKHGYNPLALPAPDPGRPGVKKEMRTATGAKGMWAKSTVFDKTWGRLSADGRIAYKG